MKLSRRALLAAPVALAAGEEASVPWEKGKRYSVTLGEIHIVTFTGGGPLKLELKPGAGGGSRIPEGSRVVLPPKRG